MAPQCSRMPLQGAALCSGPVGVLVPAGRRCRRTDLQGRFGTLLACSRPFLFIKLGP